MINRRVNVFTFTEPSISQIEEKNKPKDLKAGLKNF